MSDDSSTSDSEVQPCSSKFDPLKALYSGKSKPPVKNAPMYENVNQFESSLMHKDIIPVGERERVIKREEEKRRNKIEKEKELEEKNKQRFAKYEGMVPTKPLPNKKKNNVLGRMEKTQGVLSVLKDCVDKRLRIKVITRSAKGTRGVLHANLVAFDKQWNMALTDVLEIWTKKSVGKRKVPPALGTPVPKGTAAKISSVPIVTETPLGKGVWECTRHLPQIMVRGEHVVLVSVVR